MKKYIFLLSILSSSCALAAAGEQTLSVGFIQSKSDGLSKLSDSAEVASREAAAIGSSLIGEPARLNSDGYSDPMGMFIRYRYEFNDDWGVIGSFAYAAQDGASSASIDDPKTKLSYKNKAQVKGDYVSVMAGPTFRINSYISVYGMIGVAWKKYSIDWSETLYQDNQQLYRNGDGESQTKTDAAYSIGIQYNIWKNLTLDASYEGTTGSGDWKTNGFTIGAGYKF